MSAAELHDQAIQIREPENLTAKEIRAQVNLVQEVMKAVMQNGTHYGKIPGCGEKPTLLKPGAEKLASTFRLAINPEVSDLSTKDVARYQVKAIITHQRTGAFLGAGVGECSSNEEKYCWRNAVCDEEYESTPEDKRRIKFRKAYDKISKIKQVRTNPADIANTVLKMSKKRALIDGILTVTGASDIFTQDIEDMPEELLDKKQSEKTIQEVQKPIPQSTSEQGPKCPKCGGPMHLVPKGITKTGKNAGKEHEAFYGCETKDCKGFIWAKDVKPVEQARYPEGSDPDPVLDREPGSDDQ